jgi:hypothetical protein
MVLRMTEIAFSSFQSCIIKFDLIYFSIQNKGQDNVALCFMADILVWESLLVRIRSGYIMQQRTYLVMEKSCMTRRNIELSAGLEY